MPYLTRHLEQIVRKAARQFPAIVLTGPRRSGKTFLLRHLFPKAGYHLLEDPELLLRVKSDPRAFLDGLTHPVILDEIQNAPELLAHARARIDEEPSKKGRWFFTGSQEFSLMHGITESMAGRAAILRLLPFSQAESPRVTLLGGGFPEALARASVRDIWFASYVQTYLERDVRAVTQVRDLAVFRRFMGLLAARHGQMLNKTDIASALGVSVPTVAQWLGILETSGLVIAVPPYFENFGKRLVKSPRIYWLDSGLVCNLLGIRSVAELERSTFLGAIWEGHVAAEILKAQLNKGRRGELFHFRDQQGLEVDFLVPVTDGRLALVECKASRTLTPSMAAPARSLSSSMGEKAAFAAVVGRQNDVGTPALLQGVSALTLPELLARLP